MCVYLNRCYVCVWASRLRATNQLTAVFKSWRSFSISYISCIKEANIDAACCGIIVWIALPIDILIGVKIDPYSEWLNKKNTNENRKKRLWACSVDDQMRREKENQIEGQMNEEREGRDLWKSVVSLLMWAWRTSKRRPFGKYENKWMWKRWIGFWKEIGGGGRKEGRKEWHLNDECSPLYSAWLVGTGQWLFGCIRCSEVWGPKLFWIGHSEKESHTGLHNNILLRRIKVENLV